METLYIGHDAATAEMKVIFDEQNFVDLVQEQLGSDARRYLEAIISDRNHCKEAADKALGEADYLECQLRDCESEATASECGLASLSEEFEMVQSNALIAIESIRKILRVFEADISKWRHD